MLPLHLTPDRDRPLDVLCIGAHSDDIEIGCAGTLLGLLDRGYRLRLTWAVLSAPGARADEARASAESLLRNKAELQVHVGAFSCSYFPSEYAALKDHLGDLRDRTSPDVIFTHALHDRHQDHRLVAELTWQAWRDHLVLEYEIPKYEGDLGHPNVFVPVSRRIAESKIDHLTTHFGSQRTKDWFTSETFQGLMRLRGIECRAPEGYAEAFVARKVML